MQFIQLTQGKKAMVDDDSYEDLCANKWRVMNSRGKLYAGRLNYCSDTGHRKPIIMHRVIVNAPSGFVVDHINGDTLDNRKNNLRICTHKENCRNSTKHIKATSKYKGVCKMQDCNRWRATIGVNGKTLHIGLYASEEDAAIAYNNAAIKYFGDYSLLNIMQVR